MINSKRILVFVPLAILSQAGLTLGENFTLNPTPVQSSTFAPSYTPEQKPTQSSTLAEPHVKLLLPENKTTFRIGEPIVLIMEFTGEAEGYTVDTAADGKQPTADTISISPEIGITHWLDEMNGGSRFRRDSFVLANLSKSPTRVTLALNDTLRFDRPGRYKVKITTSRIYPPRSAGLLQSAITLTTNEVAFAFVPMSKDEEAKEVKRLSALLDAKRDRQNDERMAAELSYLTGDASTREKVRRFRNPELRVANYHYHMFYGLYIAKNRALVVRLLETALRDATQPVESRLLSAASQIRFLQENNAAPLDPREVGPNFSPRDHPRLLEIQNEYITELAATLSKRTGASLTTTALTILSNTKENSSNATALTLEARRVLVQHFDSLHPFTQEYLLRAIWEDLRSAAFASSLKKMLAVSGIASLGVHDTALKRLIELAPEEGKAYVIAKIRDPNARGDPEVLGSLKDESLPEVDNSLLEQIRLLATSARGVDRIQLQHKASLMVRYATGTIYQEMREFYRETGVKLPLDSRAPLLAYLAKQNEEEAIPLIEQALSDLKPGEDFNLLPRLTKLYYSDGIAELLKRRLESDEPYTASHAAYLIGVLGKSDDEAVLAARLERWRREWEDRPVEADANMQGSVERELIYALLTGKAWKLTAEHAKELKQSCVTNLCRKSIRE